MGDNVAYTVLGRIIPADTNHNHGCRLARKYYRMDFDPTSKCLELMQAVAEGIEGIETVIWTGEPDTKIALIIDDGINPEDTAALWCTAFRKAAGRIPKPQRGEYTGGLSLVDPNAELHELYASENRGF